MALRSTQSPPVYMASLARPKHGSGVRTVSRGSNNGRMLALGRWRTYAALLAPLMAELEEAGALAEPSQL